MFKTLLIFMLLCVSLYSRSLEDIKSSKVLKVAMRQNDMTLDIISVNQSRLKHINMVPYMQNKSIIFTNKNKTMKIIKDLVGKKILLFDGMQSQIMLKKELEKRKIPTKVFYVAFDKKINSFTNINNVKIDKNSVNIFLIDKKTKMPFLSVYFAVFKGNVDAASADTFSLFEKLQKYTYLKGDLTPAFSLEKKMGYLSGTMPKDSLKLKKEFAKFIELSKKDGTLNALMLKYLSIDLKSYNNIVENSEN